MPPVKLSAEMALIVELLDDAYHGPAWHGPHLRGAIRGLSAQEALFATAVGRRSIWELVLHCAYWKYAIRRRIRGDKRGSFTLEGSNWFKLPERLEIVAAFPVSPAGKILRRELRRMIGEKVAAEKAAS